MEQASRRERLASALEAQFQECEGIFKDWLSRTRDDDGMSHGAILMAMSLMKTGAQLASVIARFEPAPRNIENRGSNPQ